MNKKRLETLKRVGDEISEYIKKTENIKRLSKLEIAKDYTSFRNQVRLIIKDRVKIGEEKPLFSLDEYFNDLFPEGALGWKETRDILLFGVYENLHEWLINKEEIKETLTEEELTEEEMEEV